MFANPDNSTICAMLREVRTIAVVGLSPKPSRPSHRIARALKERGYRIIPVRPLIAEILGENVFGRLDEIGEKVDLVNVFRAADQLAPIVDDCLRLGLPRLWIQEGIVNETAAERARMGGIHVVMDRCIWRDLNTICA
jgi:predicted CoA-binding protein